MSNIKTIHINEQFKEICIAAGLNQVTEFINFAICVMHESKIAPIYYGTEKECIEALPEYQQKHPESEVFEFINHVDLYTYSNHYWIFAALRKTTISIDFMTSIIKDGPDIYNFIDYKDMIFTLISLLKKQLNKKEKTNG